MGGFERPLQKGEIRWFAKERDGVFRGKREG